MNSDLPCTIKSPFKYCNGEGLASCWPSLCLAAHYQKIARHNQNILHASVIITSPGGGVGRLPYRDLSEKTPGEREERKAGEMISNMIRSLIINCGAHH